MIFDELNRRGISDNVNDFSVLLDLAGVQSFHVCDCARRYLPKKLCLIWVWHFHSNIFQYLCYKAKKMNRINMNSKISMYRSNDVSLILLKCAKIVVVLFVVILLYFKTLMWFINDKSRFWTINNLSSFAFALFRRTFVYLYW